MARIRLAALALAAVTLTACGKDATSPGAGSRLTRDEEQELALSMAASGDAYSSAVPAPSVVTLSDGSGSTTFGPITYRASHPCPKGGTITPDITISGSFDLGAKSVSVDLSGTETPAECAYRVKDVTVTVNGDPNLAITAHAAIVGALPSGALTFTQKGGFTWKTSDGRSGSCKVDLTSSADFGKNLRKVKGTFCDRTFDISGPLN